MMLILWNITELKMSHTNELCSGMLEKHPCVHDQGNTE